jgi:hypothetical protein
MAGAQPGLRQGPETLRQGQHHGAVVAHQTQELGAPGAQESGRSAQATEHIGVALAGIGALNTTHPQGLELVTALR